MTLSSEKALVFSPSPSPKTGAVATFGSKVATSAEKTDFPHPFWLSALKPAYVAEPAFAADTRAPPDRPWGYDFVVGGISGASIWGDYTWTEPWRPSGGPFQTVLWNVNGSTVQPYYTV